MRKPGGTEVFERISEIGVVPVIEIDDASCAVGLADALAEGGLPVAEITFRTAAAEEALRAIASGRPELILAAGTVLSARQAEVAAEAGAQFALSPGFDRETVARARELSLPFVPGVMTPSEVLSAVSAGCRFAKFFPAVPAGGSKALQSIAAPFRSAGIRFNPTGGVNPGNMAEWLRMPDVFAVGGSWIASRGEIESRNWQSIAAKARAAVEAVREARSAA